jgi:hypothetical protein
MAVVSNGTTLIDAGAISVTTGALVLIKTLTASVSDDLTFLNGSSDVVFDSTYKEYIFKLISNHPYADPGIISFQATTDGTNYNTTVTSSYFRAYHNEADDSSALQYATGFDQAQGTAIQGLDAGSGSDNDQASSGTLRIFDPSNTTFVKHFIGQVSAVNDGDFNHNVFASGYFNTTSAITGIRFIMDSGTMQAGTIKMYGVT